MKKFVIVGSGRQGIAVAYDLLSSSYNDIHHVTMVDVNSSSDTEWSSDNENCNYTIDITSYLPIDEDGYYLMNFISGYTQTFTTLTSETESYEYNQKVAWLSNKEININIPLPFKTYKMTSLLSNQTIKLNDYNMAKIVVPPFKSDIFLLDTKITN